MGGLGREDSVKKEKIEELSGPRKIGYEENEFWNELLSFHLSPQHEINSKRLHSALKLLSKQLCMSHLSFDFNLEVIIKQGKTT